MIVENDGDYVIDEYKNFICQIIAWILMINQAWTFASIEWFLCIILIATLFGLAFKHKL